MKQENKFCVLWAFLIMSYTYEMDINSTVPPAVGYKEVCPDPILFFSSQIHSVCLFFFFFSNFVFVYLRMSSALRGERILHFYSSRGIVKAFLTLFGRKPLSKYPCHFCIMPRAGNAIRHNVKGRSTVKFTILWRTLSGKRQTVRGRVVEVLWP